MNERPRALLLDTINADAFPPLHQARFDVETFSASASTDELIERLEGVQVLGIRSRPKLPKELFAQAKDLQAVGVFGVGTDHVDVQSASERGVMVFNAPFENGRAVAEWTIGATYSLLRRLHEHSASMHQGVWSKTDERSFEVRGKTMGVIGFGNIGRQVVDLAEKNDMRAVYYDKHVTVMRDMGELPPDERSIPLAALLEISDIVTLHVPGSKTPILGADQIARMKQGSYIINGSRGAALDYQALKASVARGWLAGAAFDVYPDGDPKPGEPFVSEFQGDSRYLLTPHIGGSSTEAQTSAARNVSQRLANFVTRGAVEDSVNMESFDPGPKGDLPRLVYAHRNVPFAEAELNDVLAEHGVNIEKGDLRTNGTLGLVVKDLKVPIAEQDILAAVQGLNHSISARLI